MASHQNLSAEQVEELQEAFAVFDTNKTGSIATEQLGPLMRSMGQNCSEAELKEMMSDCGGGASVDFQGFIGMIGKRMKDVHSPNEIREAFKVFDRTGDGTVSSAELRNIMTQMGERFGEEEADEMIREADPNGTGRVNYTEFVQLMTT